MNSFICSRLQIQSESGWLPSYKLHTTIALVGTTCLAGQVDTVVFMFTTGWDHWWLFSSAAFVTLYGTGRASHHGASFQVCSDFIFLCPATEVCYVFSNTVLPCSYGGQPKATTISCIVSWGALGAPNQQWVCNELSTSWYWDVYLISQCLFGKYCPLTQGTWILSPPFFSSWNSVF